MIENGFMFNKALLKIQMDKKPRYVIGVDSYNKDALAYCLGKELDGSFEVLLAKTIRNKMRFEEEVQNLAKYFGADIISE